MNSMVTTGTTVTSIISTWTFSPVSGLFKAELGLTVSWLLTVFFFSHFLAYSNVFFALDTSHTAWHNPYQEISQLILDLHS